MSQIDLVKDKMGELFPDLDYQIQEVITSDNEKVLEIVWVDQLGVFDVFSEIGYLSGSFNTTPEEAELYPYKISIKPTLNNNSVENTTYNDKLKRQILQNDRLAQKILGTSANGNFTLQDTMKIKLKINKVKHLIRNDFQDFVTNVPTVDNLINTRLQQADENEREELQKFIKNPSFLKVIGSVRDEYRNTYLTKGFEDFFDKVISRKTNAVQKARESNVIESNNRVLSNVIRRNQHKGKVEELFSGISSEDMKSPLFEVPNNSRYEETLEKVIMLSLEGNNLSPIEHEIFKHSDNKKQTINTLEGFDQFGQKMFDGNRYIEYSLGDNSALVFTDDLIIIKQGNQIATKLSSNLNEKFSTVITFLSK